MLTPLLNIWAIAHVYLCDIALYQHGCDLAIGNHMTRFYNMSCFLTSLGLSEECKVATPAFTDALRLYRQAKGHYGTWDMMCGNQAQVGEDHSY